MWKKENAYAVLVQKKKLKEKKKENQRKKTYFDLYLTYQRKLNKNEEKNRNHQIICKNILQNY